MRQNNLLDVKVQKQKVKVIKHNPKISEPMPKYLSTGHRFANTSNPTLTASSSAQYQYPAHGSATVFIQSPRTHDEVNRFWDRSLQNIDLD